MIIPRNNDHIFNSIIGLSPIDMMNYVMPMPSSFIESQILGQAWQGILYG